MTVIIKENRLHILNGQEMYHYYKRTNFLNNEPMIPFNEAMCFGATSPDLFSDEFVKIRSEVHHVTPIEYHEITLNPLKPLFSKNYTQIVLWFDEDMFCQINLLTILAWLDMAGYTNPIDLHIVGDSFVPNEDFTLYAKGYYQVYTKVLLDKTSPGIINPDPLKKGIELYLNYLNNESNIMTYIKQHQHTPLEELVPELIEKFQEYGLGDVQYAELVNACRK